MSFGADKLDTNCCNTRVPATGPLNDLAVENGEMMVELGSSRMFHGANSDLLNIYGPALYQGKPLSPLISGIII